MADDYLWLENIDGNEALAWVRKQNEAAAQTLANRDSFARIKDDIRGALDSDEKIPAVSKVGDYYYNFWRDSTHVRGIWRRTTPASYATDNPEWETVLDIDALAQTEEENWVWHGALLLREDLPDGNRTYRRALVSLSRGGADANVTREFDLETKQWVEGGFYRPESKGGMSWIDQDTVFVFTDTGEGS
ncbi:MAG TPA: S9 family peptidase, partial [Beutenbergiaceae bacterium]|nr:S9 family peptidase [Beutenbergiaceae bacterium]